VPRQLTRSRGVRRTRLWLVILTVAAPLAAVAPPAQGAPFAYVVGLGGTVSQYNLRAGLLTPKSTDHVAAGRAPIGVAVSPDGKSVYVANEGGMVSQYDVGAGGALSPKRTAQVAAGDGPFAVAVSPDGKSVYVANEGGGVSQYDVGAGGALSAKSPATVAAGVGPLGVAVSPDG
jgi:DNA-binding beta-propeller fold protein YncE